MGNLFKNRGLSFAAIHVPIIFANKIIAPSNTTAEYMYQKEQSYIHMYEKNWIYTQICDRYLYIELSTLISEVQSHCLCQFKGILLKLINARIHFIKRVKRDISIIFVILGFSLELKIESQVFLTHPTIAAYNIRK